MCTEIWVQPDGPEIDNQGKLAAFLGVRLEDLRSAGYYPPAARKPDVCLCPIEVTEMLTEAGYRWEYDRGDPMLVMVTGKST